jgi:hypothetical protein
MGRSAHEVRRATDDDRGVIENGHLHRVEDDLNESWIETWAHTGVEAIEEYLAKYLAFLAYLDEASAA